MNYLADFDFVFGTRIHGNVMGLLSGVPSYVLAHDSRTLELARYFEIPHTLMSDVDTNSTANVFFDKADYGPMSTGHKNRFDRWVKFLEKNNLRHVYQEGEDKGLAFAKAKLESKFPSEMSVIKFQNDQQLRQRLVWQAGDANRRLRAIERNLETLDKSNKISNSPKRQKQPRRNWLFDLISSKGKQ